MVLIALRVVVLVSCINSGSAGTEVVMTVVFILQIRHFQRTSFAVPGPLRDHRLTVNDFVISGRPCGGSHTVMYNQLRRPAKLAQYNQMFASTGRFQLQV